MQRGRRSSGLGKDGALPVVEINLHHLSFRYNDLLVHTLSLFKRIHHNKTSEKLSSLQHCGLIQYKTLGDDDDDDVHDGYRRQVAMM